MEELVHLKINNMPVTVKKALKFLRRRVCCILIFRIYATIPTRE